MTTFFRWRLSGEEKRPTTAPPRTDEEVRQLLRLLPRYRVLLHNDDYNDMAHVVRALMRVVTPLSVGEAVRIMLEAHSSGVALVIVCVKELAEHYRDGLQRHRLTATIEPD